MKVLFKYILIIFCFAVLSTKLYAQTENILFSHLNIDNGLSHNIVSSIVQDNHGFIWIATNDGLNRYNGFSFEIFTTADRRIRSLSDNFITKLFVDSQNRVWIGTRSGGINLYLYENDDFVWFPTTNTAEKSSNATIGEFITSIAEDSNKNIWISSTKGLSKYSNINQKFEHYDALSSEIKLSNSNIGALCIDNNKLWIGYANGEIDILDLETNEKQQIEHENFDNNCKINAILKAKTGEYFIGTDGCGMFVFDGNLENVNHYTGSEYKATKKIHPKLKNNVIRHFMCDKDSNIWISTDGGGLHKFNPKNKRFSYINYSAYNENSLSNDAVYCSYEDNERNLWVGTIRGGVDIFMYRMRNFNHFHHINNNNRSLGFNNVSCFCEAPDNKIWIGTDGGGLSIFDPQNKTFINNQIPEIQYNFDGDEKITSIQFLSPKELWIVIYGKKLLKINLDKKTVKEYIAGNGNAKNLSTNKIGQLYIDSKNNLWLGTHGGGVCRYYQNTDTFACFKSNKNMPKSLLSNFISWITEADDSYLWVGTYTSGLHLLNKKSGECKFYVHNEDKKNSLSKNTITCLYKENNEYLWIGTDGGGLNRLNTQTGRFVCFSNKYKIPNNSILGIVPGNKNILWISTNKGLVRFNTDSYRTKHFDKRDGLQSNQFLKGAFLKSSDNNIYFGGINGFNVFNPNEIKPKQTPSDVLITGFRLMFRNVRAGEKLYGKTVLKKSIIETDKIVLDNDHNSFEFEFIAIDYSAPHKYKYKYKLANFDTNYIVVKPSKRYAPYTNIPPGNYRFIVMASINNGAWSDKQTIDIEIEKPFWQTYWFWSICTILAVFIIIGGFQYRIILINKQKERLEKTVRERTSEIVEQKEELYLQSEELRTQTETLEKSNKELENLNAAKDKFFSIIAHDIKNPLSAFLTVSDLLKEQYNDISENDKHFFIEEINHKARRLYSLLENLLQWSISQTGRIDFSPKSFNLKEMVMNTISLFSSNAKNKKINIATEIDGKLQVYADMNMISTVLRNLISNAIKFTPAGGKINIDAKIKNGYTYVSVKDTGIGLSKEDMKKLFRIEVSNSSIGDSPEKGTGLGLILCKEFVERNNGSILVNSSLGKGTTFTFSIPLSKKIYEQNK